MVASGRFMMMEMKGKTDSKDIKEATLAKLGNGLEMYGEEEKRVKNN